MKKSFMKVSNVFLVAGAFALMFSSCSSSQKVAQGISPKDDGEVLLQNYCYGDEYNSTAKALRHSAVGESMDQQTSQRKAESECRAGLAAAVNTLVKGVTDNYVKSGTYNNKEELMKNFEGVNREVVNQSISGSIVICKKQTRLKSGNYKTYICMEMGGSEILQNLNNRASSNEMLKVDYNYEKFKNTFNEEMSKQEKK
jgi:hypothetical protein